MQCPKCGSRNIMEYLEGKFECLDCDKLFWGAEEKDVVSTINYKQNLALHTSRRELVKTLASKYDYHIISKNDITDEIIDLNLYNQKIEKQRSLRV